MRIAMQAAEFTPEEANACAARWRRFVMSALCQNLKDAWSIG